MTRDEPGEIASNDRGLEARQGAIVGVELNTGPKRQGCVVERVVSEGEAGHDWYAERPKPFNDDLDRRRSHQPVGVLAAEQLTDRNPPYRTKRTAGDQLSERAVNSIRPLPGLFDREDRPVEGREVARSEQRTKHLEVPDDEWTLDASTVQGCALLGSKRCGQLSGEDVE